MLVTLTGATGFLGTRLLRRLHEEGHETRVVSRRGPLNWDRIGDALKGADAVVHMAGEPVAQRWTAEHRRQILGSRVETTRKLVEAMAAAKQRPQTLVSMSAIGYYGSRGEEILSEDSSPGTGFLPEVCIAWEREAAGAEQSGVRVAIARVGLVLGRGGGMLKPILPAFQAGLGGRLGDGQQWMSWIHIDDMIEMICFALVNASVRGPFNGVAPNPVRNAEFASALGTALHRPAIFPVPAFALKAIFGDMAEVMLASQRVSPDAAQRAGFRHRFPELGGALADLLRKS